MGPTLELPSSLTDISISHLPRVFTRSAASSNPSKRMFSGPMVIRLASGSVVSNSLMDVIMSVVETDPKIAGVVDDVLPDFPPSTGAGSESEEAGVDKDAEGSSKGERGCSRFAEGVWIAFRVKVKVDGTMKESKACARAGCSFECVSKISQPVTRHRTSKGK